MKKNIVLLTLSGCELCTTFKELLLSNKIYYHELDANINDALSDRVEVVISNNTYPIVILSDHTPDVTYCYRTTDPTLLGHRTLPTGDSASGFSTLGELFNYINK